MTPAAGYSIRPARWGDIVALHHVDVSACAMYEDFGVRIPRRGDEGTASTPGLFEDGSTTWAAVDRSDSAVGYSFAYPVEDTIYVAQLSVHRDHQRRGLGTALLDTVEAWAAKEGLGALSLVTYTDVPWNAPWYRRIGFVDVPAMALSSGLHNLLERALADGSEWRRSLMCRTLPCPQRPL